VDRASRLEQLQRGLAPASLYYTPGVPT
jgi:hypothetical protein